MAIGEYILKRIWEIFKYAILMLFSAMAIILIFAGMYRCCGVASHIRYSFEVFVGIGDICSEVYAVSVLEIAVKYIYSAAFVGGYLMRFLEPLNTVLFSKYFLYNTVTGKLTFRYWIVLRRKTFLHNVNLRIFITSDEERAAGVTESDSEYNREFYGNVLPMARGVRILNLSRKETSELLAYWKENKDKCLYFIISGINESGKYVSSCRQYLYKNLIENCSFIHIENILFQEKADKKGFNRYNYFDKLFVENDTENYDKTKAARKKYPEAAKDILIKEEFSVTRFKGKGIKAKLTDVYSEVISWVLNR